MMKENIIGIWKWLEYGWKMFWHASSGNFNARIAPEQDIENI
jgi:hypothetical protein